MRILNASITGMILACFFTNSSLHGEEWNQFRGPGGQGASSAKNLPVKWDNNSNIAWKRKLPGAGASSPISLNGKLYLTCYSGYGTYPETRGTLEKLTLHLVCVDAKSTKIVFDKKIPPAQPESKRVRDHGYAAPTPTTDGKHLFVFFGKSGVFKFDLEGNQIWKTSVGTQTHGWGCGTSPVLYKDIVIVNASVESGELVGIDKKSGDVKWRQEGIRRAWNTPHIVKLENGKSEVVVSVQGKVLAFDPESGKKLWECYGIQDYVCPSIISKDGIVYAIGGRKSQAIAIKAGGSGDVTETHRKWVANAGANVSSPIIHDGHLYWVSDRNRTAYCLKLSNGEVVTKRRFPAQPYASALFGDGKVYIVTRSSGTYVLEAKPDFPILSHNDIDDGSTFNASPIVADGKLYLRSDSYLYCIGK